MPNSLIISKKELSCKNVAIYLKHLGYSGNVSENHTIMEDGSEENGCSIAITNIKDAKSLWLKLKSKFDLTCAYYDAPPKFQGCIYDYIRPSVCPANINVTE